MAKIFPFRGLRYAAGRVGDLSRVVAEPYDKIDDALRETYYARHPQNIVRIIKGRTYPDDTGENNQYTRARDRLKEWMEDGTLIREESPALYVYRQTFTVPGGGKKVRTGFMALGEIEEPEKGGIKPHERTLAKPKIDRLNLMRATRAQFGHIFMLYSDPDGHVAKALDEETQRAPDIDVTTEDDGVRHRIWIMGDARRQEPIAGEMARRPLFIADGHHRYETALNFRNEMAAQGKRCGTGSENFNNRMMTFVRMEDPGLVILPTHRLLFNLPAGKVSSLLEEVKDLFEVREIAGKGEEGLRKMIEAMKPEGDADHRFGLFLNGRFMLLRLRSEASVDLHSLEGASPEWRRLDVSILHTLILERVLDIGKEKLERESNVAYERHPEAAARAVEDGRAQLAFFLNPTRASQVRSIAGKGEKMPQKSTDFYPKILTGFVMNGLTFEE